MGCGSPADQAKEAAAAHHQVENPRVSAAMLSHALPPSRADFIDFCFVGRRSVYGSSLLDRACDCNRLGAGAALLRATYGSRRKGA
jgi:hypothetical protein